MAVVINRHAANVHLHLSGRDRFKDFFSIIQAIINLQHYLRERVGLDKPKSLRDALIERNC